VPSEGSIKLLNLNATAQTWKLITVLPNLPLNRTWEFEPFAFVPSTDDRLAAIRESSTAAQALLDNFKDAFGRKREPAALIVRDDAITAIPWNNIVDLRNAFAISCICNAWQKTIGSKNAWSLLYSDYFDFYPFVMHRDGIGLIHLGFGLSSYDNADDFSGQPHPDLPSGGWNFHAIPDDGLLKVLIERWRKRIQLKRRSWQSEALFRSLAVAFRAARLPKGSDNQLFDLGIQLSLWVSAHECLVHPGKKGKADFREVLSLLGKRHWLYASLRRKTRLLGQTRQTPPLNYVQKLYFRLHRARNAFLHGNPVKSDLMFIGKTHSDSLFVKAAPLIYQTALESTLVKQRRRRFRDKREAVVFIFRHAHLERALTTTRKRRDQP